MDLSMVAMTVEYVVELLVILMAEMMGCLKELKMVYLWVDLREAHTVVALVE